MEQTKHTVFALINHEPNCEKKVEETVMAVSQHCRHIFESKAIQLNVAEEAKDKFFDKFHLLTTTFQQRKPQDLMTSPMNSNLFYEASTMLIPKPDMTIEENC